jgi:hypothetical protein
MESERFFCLRDGGAFCEEYPQEWGHGSLKGRSTDGDPEKKRVRAALGLTG